MMRRGELVFGGALVGLGVLLLLSVFFQINFWAFCWPIALIGVGVWLIFRPNLARPGRKWDGTLIGDLRRQGHWSVRAEDLWLGIGDINLDLLDADIPNGETEITITSFVGDINIFVPHSVGVAVTTSTVVLDANVFGDHCTNIFTPYEMESEGYRAAEKRVRIRVEAFVADMDIRAA